MHISAGEDVSKSRSSESIHESNNDGEEDKR